MPLPKPLYASGQSNIMSYEDIGGSKPIYIPLTVSTLEHRCFHLYSPRNKPKKLPHQGGANFIHLLLS